MRTFARSPYDHVGIFLVDPSKKVYLLEATGKAGVTAIDMHHFLQNDWHKLYKKLAYRKLICEKDDEFYRTFIRFANTVLGRKYSLSIKKLMRSKTSHGSSEKQTNEGYFCSELVAAFFKALKLLPENKAASRYWPGSFAARSKLKLINGAKLGPEMLVDFDL